MHHVRRMHCSTACVAASFTDYVNTSHVSHMIGTCHTYGRIMSHGCSAALPARRLVSLITYTQVVSHTWMCNVPHMDNHAPLITCVRVMSQIYTSHVPTQKWVMSHVCTSVLPAWWRVSLIIYIRIMSHTWMSHIPMQRSVMWHL